MLGAALLLVTTEKNTLYQERGKRISPACFSFIDAPWLSGLAVSFRQRFHGVAMDFEAKHSEPQKLRSDCIVAGR
ncbi:MAG: hypothetical protein ACREV4_15270 [Gammaproteobacteria bacterium]